MKENCLGNNSFSGVDVTGVGTDREATSAMPKAGADNGAKAKTL